MFPFREPEQIGMPHRKTPPALGHSFGRMPSDQMNYMEFGDRSEPGDLMEEGGGEGKISKSVVLYIHREGTDYQCKDCSMWVGSVNGCTIHKPGVEIKGEGSCGLWVDGDPMPDAEPHGYLTHETSGYDESPEGFSCKRCRHFIAEGNDCHKTDKDSPGDDPGEIHPDACCNHWEGMDGEEEKGEVEIEISIGGAGAGNRPQYIEPGKKTPEWVSPKRGREMEEVEA